MKRTLALLLTLLMLVSLMSGLSITASAAARDTFTYTYEGQTLRYTVLTENGTTGTVSVQKNSSPSGKVIIPESVKNGDVTYSVTTIGEKAFYICSNLSSVTIPDSVTTIGVKAFYACNNLSSVTIPDSVTTISEKAFAECNINSVTIPASVKAIGPQAFETVDFKDATFLGELPSIFADSFKNITIKEDTEYTDSNISVKIVGFRNGKDNTEAPFWRSELLKPVVTGYTGTSPLYYRFKTGNVGIDDSLSFSYSDMSKEYMGGLSLYSRDEAYASIRYDGWPTYIECSVYTVEKGSDGTFSAKLLATSKKVDLSHLGNGTTEEMEDANRAEFETMPVIVMRQGERATIGELLGKAGITHINCVSCEYSSLETLAYEGTDMTVGKISGGGKDTLITALNDKVGLSELKFNFKSDCHYHGRSTIDNVTMYIYVMAAPVFSSTNNSITVTDNTVTPATSTYQIGLQNTGMVSGKNTVFSGLQYGIEYDVLQTLTVNIGTKSYTGLYHNYVSTEPNYVCYIDSNNNGTFDGSDVKYTSIAKALNATGTNAATIRLISDLTENVTIPEGYNITLDLCGKILKAASEGSVIVNNGTLTITDSSTDAVHYFTVGNDGLWTLNDTVPASFTDLEDVKTVPESGSVIRVTGGVITGGTKGTNDNGYFRGGGVYNTGTLTVSGGNITGNKAVHSGGGVENRDTMEMTGGSISGNIAEGSGGVKNNEGKLTFSGGYITGNVATLYEGGGVYINGTMTMTGGSIIGNVALEASGGGVYIANIYGLNSEMTVSDGSITGNIALSGGGVFNYGTMNMTGGSINDNQASRFGGGVFNSSDSTMNMTGGAITGNTITNSNYSYCGAGVRQAGTMTVGGTAVIKNNKTNGLDDNLFCYFSSFNNTYRIISISTDKSLAAGAEIHVNKGSDSGKFTTNGQKSDEQYFCSDNPAFADKYNSGEYLELVTGYVVTKDNCENGSVSVGNLKSAYEGETVTVTVTPDSGYVVNEVFYKPVSDENRTEIPAVDGVYSFTMPHEKVTVTATFKEDNAIIGTLTCADITVGDTPAPTGVTAKYGNDTLTYIYSADGETWGTWEEIYTEPGTYSVKAVVEATEEYNGAESSAVSFEVKEADDPVNTFTAFLAKILAILPALIVFLRYIDRII